MPHHWTLHLNNGLQLNVPADLDNPVTLTLLEYEDWPEPEHAFLRQLIQPGMRLLDADTGLGLNALAMAQGLNGAGQVIALNADPPVRAHDRGQWPASGDPDTDTESNARPTSTRAGRWRRRIRSDSPRCRDPPRSALAAIHRG